VSQKQTQREHDLPSRVKAYRDGPGHEPGHYKSLLLGLRTWSYRHIDRATRLRIREASRDPRSVGALLNAAIIRIIRLENRALDIRATCGHLADHLDELDEASRVRFREALHEIEARIDELQPRRFRRRTPGRDANGETLLGYDRDQFMHVADGLFSAIFGLDPYFLVDPEDKAAYTTFLSHCGTAILDRVHALETGLREARQAYQSRMRAPLNGLAKQSPDCVALLRKMEKQLGVEPLAQGV